MISIIIPVYNSKERLAECLKSVAQQDYKPLEVIVVDDCSTDGSLEICREFEKKYSFFHVYTKKNEGVSAARNYGLKRAGGEYIQFVDSDDRLYPGACRKMAERMEREHSDLVICGYFNEKEQRSEARENHLFENREDFMKEFPVLFEHFMIHVPWNKLYRKACMTAQFPEDLSKGEDLLFNLQVLSQVKQVSLLGEVLYFYHNVNDSSLSFRFREDAMEIEERLFHAVFDFYTKQCPGETPVFLYRFYLTSVKNKCYALMGKSGWDRKTCGNTLRKWTRMDSIEELCRQKKLFGKKDRILLMLMRLRAVSVLYYYYKFAGRGEKE